MDSINSKEALILLNMAGVGRKTMEKLSEPQLQKKIAAVRKEYDLEGELRLVKKYNVDITTIFDDNYPRQLKEIHSPPLVLYSTGEGLKESEIMVAVVGSRSASVYGIMTAERLGYELASRGVAVVSGLAKGIDSAAHRGALKAHGRTVAVLGNGLKTMYPPENKELARDIADSGGALISEFPMETPPIGRNFPQRNRVISGLALGVIVVEAAKNSGALITADFALEQDREVFAVPGKVDSATSFGTNELIKQGAKLIRTAEDVLDELGLKLKGSKKSARRGMEEDRPVLSREEETIFGALSREPRYIDEIAGAANLPLSKTTELLFKLQLKKIIKELPGKNFIRA
ncbi:MAG: DNA-protecting protein DprA [Candidatus Omnitrophica bacterium]|nr:DNA-protecting protein DprA [Candidatus Omnitrophota bacterium]